MGVKRPFQFLDFRLNHDLYLTDLRKLMPEVSAQSFVNEFSLISLSPEGRECLSTFEFLLHFVSATLNQEAIPLFVPIRYLNCTDVLLP